jgi:DNA mismatch repair protein MutS2
MESLAALSPKTRADLGWDAVLAALAARTHTDRGAARARDLPLFADARAARQRLGEVAEARLLTSLGAAMPFGGLRDVGELTLRAQKGGVLEAAELYFVGETVAAVARLRRHLLAHKAEAPALAAHVESLLDLAHVSGPIGDCIGEGGHIHDHASPALGPLRRRVDGLNDQLMRRARALLDDPQVAPMLQDHFYTQREDRYVLPVRADARSKLKGIVHGWSQSGQTVFVEPEEMVALNNELRLAESEVAEEERRILAELSGYVAQEAEAIAAGLAAADTLDVIDASARLGEAMDAVAPELGDDGPLRLPSARHPLMVLSPRQCVPSDLRLDPGQTLVISGPNAGGKTVALKTIGLAALLARAGLHVPAAPGARVPFYAQVLSDIGDEQSLERNLSSFSAHLANVRSFLAAADEKTLVLLDEMAVGTEPEQGAALAQAVLEALAARGAQVVVTTHYERLKALGAQDRRFMNASVGFDLAKMAPTFSLQIGVPGSSAALMVARRMGVPPDVCGRAEALLGDRRAGIEELLVALTEERRRLDEERRETAAARRGAEQERREAEAQNAEAHRRVRELRKGAYDQAVADLKRVRDELERLAKQVRRAAAAGAAEAVDLVKDGRARVDEAKAEIAAHAPAEAAPPGRAADPAELVPGARVFVPALGGRGEVVGAPERGRVTVQIGPLRTAVAVAEVRLDATPPPNRRARREDQAVRRKPSQAAPDRRGAAATGRSPSSGPGGRPRGGGEAPLELVDGADDLAPARTPDATCDLRGVRVDDGLAELDRFLDDALIAAREYVFVIHGHGTGAMKSAVRAHLASHPAVTKSRAGATREGGDGVTVVWLDV